MIKRIIKLQLQKAGLYEYVKYSFPFQIWERIFKPLVQKRNKKEITFYLSFLPQCNIIFDIGAYDGHKTAAFLTISKRIVSIEPDTFNYRALQIRFRNKTKRVFIENKAISSECGEKQFYINHPGSAFNTLNKKWVAVLENDNIEKWDVKIKFAAQPVTVSVITLDTLVLKYGRPDFIKIDTEGHEEEVLKGLTQKIPFLSFECLLPDFRNELNNCLKEIDRIDDTALFNIAQDEKLLFSNFISTAQLKNWINTANIYHFEIVVKMNL